MNRLISILVVCCAAQPVFAQSKSVRVSKRAIDMIVQKNGPMLLGSILDQTADGVRIVVSREWLGNAHPELFKKLVAAENESRQRRLETLLKRLDAWMKERSADQGLQFALKPEKRRVEEQLAQRAKGEENLRDEPPQFFVITVDAGNVRKVNRKSPDHRRVVGFAWQQRLKDVETRSTTDLIKELRELKVGEGTDMPNLAGRLPATEETADEFAIRKAFFEYKFRKSLDFQGTGGMLLKAGDGAADIDAKQLFGQLLGGGGLDLQSLLGANGLNANAQVDDGSKAIDKAKQTAESEGVTAFRITRMKHDLAQMKVTVTTQFYARLAKDKWKLVHAVEVPTDVSKADPTVTKQIKDDDRVKSILAIAEAAGIGGDSVDKAVQFGAATQVAQGKADGKFQQFLEKYIRQVDSPPLPQSPKTVGK